MLLISSPRFEDHVPPPGHPERPGRGHVFDAVATRWKQNGGRVVPPRAATRAELERVHTGEYIDQIERTAGRAAMLDPDTFTSPDSESVARLAAGAAVQAVEHAVATHETVFALVRPPGHHAERHRAMGFCLYNNVAIAAAAALHSSLERVAIVDIDVHHGNGTQHIFYDQAGVLYVSTHQFPFYPGTGDAHEVGSGAGTGFTVNVPLEAGSTDADYDLVYRAIVEPVLDEFSPQLTLVSAGYDAHERDPLASMRVTTAGYASIVRRVRDSALRSGPLVLVTEGGYELTALASCLEASFAVLESGKDESSEGGTSRSSTAPRGERAVAAAATALAGFWNLKS